MNLRSNLTKTVQAVLLVLLCTTGLWAQTGSISGKITDEDTRELMVGATVGVKGTTLGAATGPDGYYFIGNVPAGQQTLVIQSIGYTPKEVTVTIEEGQNTILNFTLKVNALELKEVIVTGLRKSQIDAINTKKQALNNINVLKTDDIGRLPDINVAEAAQRIPGVAIETDNGEGRFISIRGIQPSLNNVTLNNSNIGSTDQGRETPLDLLPVEMISSIEVTKANTPDMEGNAIGGAININTISAFDRSAPQFLIASVDGFYQEQQADYGDDKLPYRLALTTGKRFGKEEKFGAVFSANYFRRDFSVSILDPDRWELLKGTDPQGNPTPGYLGPNEIEIQIEDNERVRYGLTADLEFRPTNRNSIYFRSLYTHTDETDFNSEFELTVAGVRDQQLTNQTPTSGRFSRGSGELDLSSTDEREDLYSFILGTRNRFGNFSLDVNGTFSQANQNLFNIDGTHENDQATEGLLSNTYNIEPFFFEIEPEDKASATDPSIFFLRNLNFRRDNTVVENLYEGTADLRYDFTIGNNIPAYLKAGGRFRSRQKEVDRSQEQYDDDNVDGSRLKATNRYTLELFNLVPVVNPVQGGTNPNVHGDAFAFRKFFEDPKNLLDTTRLFFRPNSSAIEEFDEDINYREDVTAAYLMGVFNFKKFTLTAGARVERTKATSSPYVETENGFEQIDFTNSYTNFLPSVHLRANFTDNFIGRLSWSNTIGRPDYDQLSGTSEFNFMETTTPGVYTGSFEGANPNLSPLESMNLDLSLEYYFKSGGLLSAGAFYKDIDNQIFTVSQDERNITFQDLFFEEINFSRNVNLNAAQVYGVEFGYDQAFTFLPPPFDGFGITTNVAFIESEATYPNREGDNLPLFRQPSNVFNIIPYYQKYGLEIRAAITHRSNFLVTARGLESSFVKKGVEAGFSITDFDVYEAARTSVDVTAAYNFPGRKFRILAQARNLSNSPEQLYQGNPSRYDRHQLFGRSFFLGFSVNL